MCSGRRSSTVGGSISLESEIGTGDSSDVGEVNNQAAITEETAETLFSAGEFIEVLSRERIRSDSTVLARKIPDLTCLRESRVARWCFAANEWVKMA